MKSCKTVAFISQKGGSGKSTTSANFAVAAGLRTCIFDLDQQESITMWAARRKAFSDSPQAEFITERRLSDAIREKKSQGFQLLIIDTPPNAGPEAYTAAQEADLVLIPCRPSLIDIDAIRRTAQLVKSAGVKAFVLFNAVPPTATTLIGTASQLITEKGLTAAPVTISERRAFKASWPLGKGVTEHERYSKAAKEIMRLKEWVIDLLKL